MPGTNFQQAAAPWVLTVLPFAALFVFVHEHGVDLPFFDEWELVALLERVEAGTWTFWDFTAQHNEHRIPVARALIAALAQTTGWDLRAEMYASVAIAALEVAGLAVLSRGAARSLGVNGWQWSMPPIALLVCSWHQWESWLWGMQVGVFACLAAVIAAFALVVRVVNGRLAALLPAIALGVVASFSFGAGLAVWPLGLLLFAVGSAPVRHRVWAAAAWSVVGAVVLAGYVMDFDPTRGTHATDDALEGPKLLARYVCAFLGSTLWRPGLGGAMQLGAAVLAVTTALGAVVLWNRRLRDALLPLLLVGAFGMCCAVVIGLGRATVLGVNQASTSRYVTLSTTTWVALIAVGFLAARSIDARRHHRRWTLAWAMGVAFVCLLLLFGQPTAWRAAAAHAAFMRDASRALLADELDPAAAAVLFPRPAEATELTESLRRHRWSAFRHAGHPR